MTPTVSTIAMGGMSIVLYAAMNYMSSGALVIADAVIAIGLFIVVGGLMLYFLGGWSLWLDCNVATDNDYTMWTVPGIHWQVGGAFVIAVIAVLAGLACYACCRITRPAFFRKQTLTRATPTLTPGK